MQWNLKSFFFKVIDLLLSQSHMMLNDIVAQDGHAKLRGGAGSRMQLPEHL